MWPDKSRLGRLTSGALIVAFLAACSAAPGGGTTAPGASASAPEASAPAASAPSGNTLLDKVKSAGKIVIAVDPAYPPQSSLTADGGYEGFDIDIEEEIVKRLGVDIEWVTPSFDAQTAGSWGGRFDMSSMMAVTATREKVLAYPHPVYFNEAAIAVRNDSPITSIQELAGKVICTDKGSVYEHWLKGTLEVPGLLASPPPNLRVEIVDSPTICSDAIRAGRRDWDAWLENSGTMTKAIDAGVPIKMLDETPFFNTLTVAFDRSGLDPTTMVAEVSAIIDAMHAEGLIKASSEKWFGRDLSQKPT